MLLIAATLLAASQPASELNGQPLGQTAQIFSTVGHSEFCPAGNVRLDLRTGQYAFTARAPRRVCNNMRLERPSTTGTLDAQRLAALRAAFQRVLNEGISSVACREGRRPRDIIMITNGGIPILVLTTGSETMSASTDLICWSDAANSLHAALEEAFPSPLP
jgi:hypothetical protein